MLDARNSPSRAFAGQKRSIDQVDSGQLEPTSATSSFGQGHIQREDEFFICEENSQSTTDTSDKEVGATWAMLCLNVCIF